MTVIEGFTHPPHDIDCEQALLGSMLINNQAFHAVDGIVEPESFYEPVHRKIYRLIGELVRGGGLADQHTLTLRIAEHPSLADIDARSYLANMARAAETVLNAPDYARLLADLALRRRIISVSDEASKIAYDTSESDQTAAEIAVGIQDSIARLLAGSETGEIKTARSVLHDLLGRIDRGVTPYPTGFSAFDKSFGGGMRAGSLYAIEGRAKRFKTGTAAAIYHGLWTSGTPAMFVSLELSPGDIVQRAVAGHAGMSYLDAERERNRTRFIEAGLDFEKQRGSALDQGFFAHAPGASFPRIMALCSQAMLEHDCRVFVVDYWQRIPNNDPERNQSQHLEFVANGLADFAARHNAVVLMASQLNRQDESLASSGLERACAWRGKIHLVDIPTACPTLLETGIWVEVTENRYGHSMDIGSTEDPAFRIAPGPTLEEI